MKRETPSLILPQAPGRLDEALMAIASKASRGEIRSFFVVVVNNRGGEMHTQQIDPSHYDHDVQALGNAILDATDKLTRTATELRGKVHALNQ